MKNLIKSFLQDANGATMVEYGLMLALIALICIAAVTSIGERALTNLFGRATDTIGGIGGGES